MVKSKRALVFLMVSVLVFSMASSAFAAAKYVMKFNEVGSDKHPTTWAFDEFVERINKVSNGEIEIAVYRNSQLGGDRQTAEGMQIGTIEMGIVGSSVLMSFAPEIGVFDFPFIFKTEEAAYKALDGEVGEVVRQKLLEKGLRVMAYGVNGYRHVTNSRNPVYKPEDLSGIKIRTMENPIFVESFRMLGANPTPMSFSELYTALQQHTVDAQENPILLIATSNLYEVQKYISKTGHAYAVAPLVMSERYFQSLPKDIQDLMLKETKVFEARQRELMRENEAKFEDEMRKAGVEINELTGEQKDEFIKLCEPVYAQFEDRVGKELLDMARAAND